MSRQHAGQAAIPGGQRRRLHGAERGRGRYVTVWREPRIGGDIGDHHLGIPVSSPAAGRTVVAHDGEIREEFRAEPALGGDPQRSRRGIGDLDVTPVRVQEFQGEVQDLIEQAPGSPVAPAACHAAAAPPAVRRVRACPLGELLRAPGLLCRASSPQPDSRAAKPALGLLPQVTKLTVALVADGTHGTGL